MDNDAERLYELLNNSHTSFAEKLNEDLKSEYLAVFREAYAGKDKNFILGTGEIEKLVENAGNSTYLKCRFSHVIVIYFIYFFLIYSIIYFITEINFNSSF